MSTHEIVDTDSPQVLSNKTFSNLPAIINTQIGTTSNPVTQLITTDPWVDVRAYGAKGDGVTDDTAAIQAAITSGSGKTILIPSGNYLISTALTIPADTIICGLSRGNSQFTYSGSGIALDGYGHNDITLQNFSVNTTNTAATAIRLGGASQHHLISNVALYGDTSASNTGTGLLLDATGSTNAFSSHLSTDLFYTLGYKYGIRVIGSTTTKTWTSMNFRNTFLIGRGGGIITGSQGLSFDANTVGVGSTYLGGTIEGFDTGLSIANGSGGIEFIADIEGNNTAYTVGASFQGQIKLNGNTGQYTATANGTTNSWHKELIASGIDILETHYDQKRVIDVDNVGDGREFGIYQGASIIGGGSPTLFWKVFGNGSFATPQSTYMQFGTHKISYATAAPTAGTWIVGDIVWNNGVVAGGSPGWICTTGGTPGTWKTMANVAA